MPIVCPKAKIVKCVKIGLDKHDIFGSVQSYVEFYVAHNLVYRDWALIVLKLVLCRQCFFARETTREKLIEMFKTISLPPYSFANVFSRPRPRQKNIAKNRKNLLPLTLSPKCFCRGKFESPISNRSIC